MPYVSSLFNTPQDVTNVPIQPLASPPFKNYDKVFDYIKGVPPYRGPTISELGQGMQGQELSPETIEQTQNQMFLESDLMEEKRRQDWETQAHGLEQLNRITDPVGTAIFEGIPYGLSWLYDAFMNDPELQEVGAAAAAAGPGSILGTPKSRNVVKKVQQVGIQYGGIVKINPLTILQALAHLHESAMRSQVRIAQAIDPSLSYINLGHTDPVLLEGSHLAAMNKAIMQPNVLKFSGPFDPVQLPGEQVLVTGIDPVTQQEQLLNAQLFGTEIKQQYKDMPGFTHSVDVEDLTDDEIITLGKMTQEKAQSLDVEDYMTRLASEPDLETMRYRGKKGPALLTPIQAEMSPFYPYHYQKSAGIVEERWPLYVKEFHKMPKDIAQDPVEIAYYLENHKSPVMRMMAEGILENKIPLPPMTKSDNLANNTYIQWQFIVDAQKYILKRLQDLQQTGRAPGGVKLQDMGVIRGWMP